LKEKEVVCKGQLNEIDRLQSEVNIHRVEIATLRLRLIDKEPIHELSTARKINNYIALENNVRNMVKSMLNKLEVIRDNVDKYANVVNRLSEKVVIKKSLDEELKEERERLLAEQELYVKCITELKSECQKQVRNVKKSIQECRRLQGEREKFMEENELLRKRVKVLGEQIKTL